MCVALGVALPLAVAAAAKALAVPDELVVVVAVVGLVVGMPVVVLAGLRWWVLPSQALGWADLGVRRPNRAPWGLVWMVPVQFVCCVAVSVLTAQALGRGSSGGTSGLRAIGGEAPAAAIVAVAVGTTLLGPLMEEILARGVLFGWLRTRWRPLAAIVVSAAVFALAHVAWPVIPYAFVLGLFTAWARHRYDSIWPSLILHTVNNAVVTVGTLLALL